MDIVWGAPPLNVRLPLHPIPIPTFAPTILWVELLVEAHKMMSLAHTAFIGDLSALAFPPSYDDVGVFVASVQWDSIRAGICWGVRRLVRDVLCGGLGISRNSKQIHFSWFSGGTSSSIVSSHYIIRRPDFHYWGRRKPICNVNINRSVEKT